ncbi:MAG: nucleotide exchange factor GrpE [Lysobacter sp.]|nr:nucleotide exchange factor GrpE [Lysobacter sp.]
MQPDATTPHEHDPHAEPAPAGRDAVDPAEDPQNTIERLRGELEQVRADVLRERADLDNQRKRLARDVEMARKFANERLLSDLLPLFDSIEAGLAAAAENDPLREGMVLTLRQLNKIAESNGLSEVAPARGDAFDPDRHQAMSMVEAADIAPGAVAQTFQKGYLLNERLLRPALVMVAKQD